ncbi:hypothetical protein Q7P37_002206 [Cladosporium fusiforme]
MGKATDTDISLTDVTNTPISSAPDSPSKLSQETSAHRLVYVEGEKNDPGPVGPAIATFWKRRNHGLTLDDIATQPSVFDDEKLAPLYQPNPRYENAHRFDPSERWTWREEIPIIRKMDWRVTAWAAVAFFALDLPRGNISQANSDNFLDDLGLDTNDYNTGQTLFRVAFLCAELPSQLISKKIGPDVWIPAGGPPSSSAESSSEYFKVLHHYWHTVYCGYEEFMVEKGGDGRIDTSDTSFLHDANDLDTRLFLIEGILTLCIGIWSVFAMAPSPTQTKAWFRPKGWLTEREEKIMVNRILRDDPSKSDMHNREGITLSLMWKAIKDYDMWPVYLLGLTFGMPAGPPDQYLTLTLRRLGFGTFDTNLLSIPAQVLTTVNMMIMTYASEKTNQRAYFGVFSQVWMLACVAALLALPISTSNPWTTYAILTTLLSYPTPHPIQVGWCSRISGTTRTRTVSAALYNMFVQVQSIISSNIYRADDIPDYKRGNSALVSIAAYNIFLYLAVRVYFVWRNKSKDRKWKQLSGDEQVAYLETTTVEGNKKLDFRFVY